MELYGPPLIPIPPWWAVAVWVSMWVAVLLFQTVGYWRIMRRRLRDRDFRREVGEVTTGGYPVAVYSDEQLRYVVEAAKEPPMTVCEDRL